MACAAAAVAQPLPASRLPPVGDEQPVWVGADAPPTVRLAQSTEAISRPAAIEPPPLAPPPSPAERGLFQGFELSADWLPRLDDDSLGHSKLSASASFGVPPFVLGVPLLVTPRAALHQLDGPNTIDVPSRVNDLDLSIGSFKKLGERWSARGSVNVGVYGDEDSLGASDALRVSGFGVAIYEASPEWQWVIGAAYLNRDDLAVVPAFGVIHDRGDVRFELTMPRPRILWRLPQDAAGTERAIYVAGDLGGGAWAVRRTDGTTDTLNLGSWGVGLGYETKAGPGAWFSGKRRYELGYVFGRTLEYAKSGEEISLDDSLVMRVGWNY
ncbi:hypothetical protein Pla108_21740 [Botrimarina colliarenosi]|uniref:DUF6268 domain-containing protein n=2 Tax=Botrimarina colliarenosi TaxID=2528001 RepID=A0A5C6AEI7_9BACT|nr:hypothetical protein Pla108_21740 [Botrimarina colliarenosi]